MVLEPEHRVILAADIASSAGRGDTVLLLIREVLFNELREALDRSGIDQGACLREDAGDGVRLIMPAGVRKARLIHPLGYELAARLREHNRMASAAAQVRVRLVLHSGDVRLSPDEAPVGTPLEAVARLLDAPPAKEKLAASGEKAPLAIIVSRHFYETTVQHGDLGIESDSFQRVAVMVKEYADDAWLWLPQLPGASPGAEPEARSPGEAARPASLSVGPRPEQSSSPSARRGPVTIRAGRDLGPVVIGNRNTTRSAGGGS